MLDPLHLRTLTAVLETGSSAVAARRLGHTPSAVSQQIAALDPERGRCLESALPTTRVSPLPGRPR